MSQAASVEAREAPSVREAVESHPLWYHTIELGPGSALGDAAVADRRMGRPLRARPAYG